MKKLILAVSFFVCVACTYAPSSGAIVEPASDTADIIALLETQKTDWNEGDIEGFMNGYWRAPELRFASGGNVTRGWQETLDRYRANYSDRAKMGVLDFTDLEVNLVSGDAAVLHGRWQLTREQDAPHGLFTLVLRKIEGRWVIVSDTTTSGGS